MTDIPADPDKEKLNSEETRLKFEKYKFMVELFKWFIGSVVLVIITVIIDKGFKERTAGIQEMQAYDKYVEVILKADNIEERWKLSEYFATVTPTDRLRDRWKAYKDSINADYIKFKKLNEKEYELQIQRNDTMSRETLSKLDKQLKEIQNQKAQYETKLTSSNNISSAQDWEEKGFLYLLNKDVENAILSFRNSENSYNQYHQVYEISKYLIENKSKLAESNSEFWKTAFKKIAADYSWEMPSDIRNKLLENAK